jgi:hypothetical protein
MAYMPLLGNLLRTIYSPRLRRVVKVGNDARTFVMLAFACIQIYQNSQFFNEFLAPFVHYFRRNLTGLSTFVQSTIVGPMEYIFTDVWYNLPFSEEKKLREGGLKERGRSREGEREKNPTWRPIGTHRFGLSGWCLNL